MKGIRLTRRGRVATAVAFVVIAGSYLLGWWLVVAQLCSPADPC